MPWATKLNCMSFDRAGTNCCCRKSRRQLGDIIRLLFSMKVMLENLLRPEDGKTLSRA